MQKCKVANRKIPRTIQSEIEKIQIGFIAVK